MMNVRCVIASKRLLSVVRISNHRLLMDTFADSKLKLLSPHTIADSATLFSVCLDRQDNVHVVYLTEDEELLHTIYDPDTQQFDTLTIPLLYADTITSLQLFHMDQSLQLFVLTPDRLLQAKLTGLHWSAVDELIAQPNITEVHVIYENLEWRLTAVRKSEHITLLRWHYHSSRMQWIEGFSQELLGDWNTAEPLFIQKVEESKQKRVWVVLSYPRGRLIVRRYLDDLESSVLPPDLEAELITPIRQVTSAMVSSHQGMLSFTWVSDQQLFHHRYDTLSHTWGMLNASPAQEPVWWTLFASAPHPRRSPAQWISPHEHMDANTSPLSEWLLCFKLEQSLEASVTYTESSLAYMMNIMEQRHQLQQELAASQSKLLYWRQQVRQKQQHVQQLLQKDALRTAGYQQQSTQSERLGDQNVPYALCPRHSLAHTSSVASASAAAHQTEPSSSPAKLTIRGRLLSLMKRSHKKETVR
ncbi:hypothetical protein [Paenibacillus aquistagni]|uniref:hypothetical protein n=1 Tax=Paenibacillus aquistagni TaxID=1852522 RepID=UPI00145AD59C|nr:hypothetical protein [Paenibacillus aquistagni]NMM51812.1 hypothetical protein [Paenibacillus aquistagni]